MNTSITFEHVVNILKTFDQSSAFSYAEGMLGAIRDKNLAFKILRWVRAHYPSVYASLQEVGTPYLDRFEGRPIPLFAM